MKLRFWHVAHRGLGRKVVVLPEVWRHCNPDTIPMELALMAQVGRELGIELVFDTQKPELLNGSLNGAVTELVCFLQVSAAALRATENALRDSGNDYDAAQMRGLPLETFVGFNRLQVPA